MEHVETVTEPLVHEGSIDPFFHNLTKPSFNGWRRIEEKVHINKKELSSVTLKSHGKIDFELAGDSEGHSSIMDSIIRKCRRDNLMEYQPHADYFVDLLERFKRSPSAQASRRKKAQL